MLNVLVNLVAALAATFVLTLTPKTVKVGDEVTFTVAVSGPFSGQVCVAQMDPNDKDVQSHFCPQPWGEVVVKEGETAVVSIVLKAPRPGTFYFEAVGVTDEEDKQWGPITSVTVAE